MATSVVLGLAGVGTVAVIQANRDTGDDDTAWVTTAAPGDTSPTADDDGATATLPSDSTPTAPPASASSLDDALAGADLTDIDTDPNLGVTVRGDDGTEYRFADGVWTVEEHRSAPDGSGMTMHRAQLGTIVGRFVDIDGRPRFVLDEPAHETWAAEVLDTVPGLRRSGDEWQVVDPAAAAEALLEPIDDGRWVADQQGLALVHNAPTRFVYTVDEGQHLWAWDPVLEQLTLLLADGGDPAVVAGELKEGSDGSLSFTEASGLSRPQLDQVTAILNDVRSEFPEERLQAYGAAVASPALFVREGTQALPALRLESHYGLGSFIKKVAKKTGSGAKWALQKTKQGTKAAVDWSLRKTEQGWDAVTWPVSFWIPNLGYEKDCGAPGPGPNDTTSAPARASAQQMTRPLPDPGQDELLELAQAWLPLLKFSADERCGEILRIIAKVFPYDGSNRLVEELEAAARVEITYTIFFKEDGGRDIPILGYNPAHHPGDNEGFSIGLVRSSLRDERCGASFGFQLFGAAAAAHEPGKNWFQSLVTRRVISHADGDDLSGPCPELNPRTADDYLIWIAEGKHALYFDQDSCERELARQEECEDGRGPYILNSWVELYDAVDVLEPCEIPDSSSSSPPPGRFHHNEWYKDYSCMTRGEPRTSPEDTDYRVEGLMTAPFEPPPLIDPVGPTRIESETTCSTSGQRTEFVVTNLVGARPVSVLILDGSTPVLDLSGTAAADGSFRSSFDWGSTGLFGATARIEVQQVSDGTTRSVDLVVNTVAGCWPQVAEYTLSVGASGAGSVTSNPSGIDCGSDCSQTYTEGTSVTLTASPASGWVHVGWVGCNGSSSCTVTMDTDRSVTAYFEEELPDEYTLSVDVSGVGSVTSSPSGIDCGSDCSHSYAEGTSVTLTASPASGWVFAGWSGACSGSGTCTVGMTTDRNVTANFEEEESEISSLDAIDDLGYLLGPPDNPLISSTSWFIPVTENDVNPSGSLLTILDFECLQGCSFLDEWSHDTGPAAAPDVYFTVAESGFDVQLVRWVYSIADDFGGYDEAFVEVTLDFTGEDSSSTDLCGGLVPDIVGTGGDDYLVGTSGSDVIAGGAGNDQIEGLGGDDVLCGEDGFDFLVGGDGADTLYGGPGGDELTGQGGNDNLIGNTGNDAIFGDGGDDYMEGGPGDDYIEGNAGEDWAKGGLGFDTCSAEVVETCEDVLSQSLAEASARLESTMVAGSSWGVRRPYGLR